MILICVEDREGFGNGHRSRMTALIDIFEALKIDFICAITNHEWGAIEIKIRKLRKLDFSEFLKASFLLFRKNPKKFHKNI